MDSVEAQMEAWRAVSHKPKEPQYVWELKMMDVTKHRTTRQYVDEATGHSKVVVEEYAYSQYHSHLVSRTVSIYDADLSLIAKDKL